MGNTISGFFGGDADQERSLHQQAEFHRAEANKLADRQRILSAQSQSAYRAGNGGLAKSLSIQAKELHHRLEHHNKEAARLHFLANNADKPDGTIDLHGLFVKEALQQLDAEVARAKKAKRRDLTVIVGVGNHSEGGVQRIRPAVEKWCRERGHTWTVMNQGCLKVTFKEKHSFCCMM